MTRACALALAALLLLVSRGAAAGDLAAAEALFQKGRILMEKGKVAEACPIFDESYRLDPAPGTLLNIAACSRIAGKTATAWGQFLEAARAFRRKDDPRRAEFADAQAKDVEHLLAYVIIKVDRPPPSLVVHRDGQLVTAASFDLKIPMDPGTHVVVAEAEGYKRAELTFSAEPRTTTDWRIPALEPGEAPSHPPIAGAAPMPPADPSPIAAAHRGRPQRIAGFAVGGVGVASLIAGVVFVGLTAMRSSDLEELCPNKLCSTDEAKASLDEADRFANAANGLLIAGAVVAATGLVLVLTAPSDKTVAALRIGPIGGSVDLAF